MPPHPSPSQPTCSSPLPTCPQTPDVQREQEVQEHEVAALQATAGSLTVSMRGLELVVRVQMEEVDQLQRRLRQLLHDGDEEAASAVQAEITVSRSNAEGY